MKSFVIYVKGHKKSEEYLDKVLVSCRGKGFDCTPFEGVTPDTLDDYTKSIPFEDGKNTRILNFKRESEKKYRTKKSCFLNHVRLWTKCLELDEPIAVLEQDVHCAREWEDTEFSEVLVLNVNSAFHQPVFKHIRPKPYFSKGLHEYKGAERVGKDGLQYYFPNQYMNSWMMPGTGAYAVTPDGAANLLNNLAKYGWEQSDFFINTFNCKIEYIMPEYFTFKVENLNMSHGF